MKSALSYKDVALVPNYSEIESRDSITTNVKFLDYDFKCPVFPSNMACCIDFKTAENLGKEGYFYILHRFYDYSQILHWLAINQNSFPLSISVGVKENDFELLKGLSESVFKIDFIN